MRLISLLLLLPLLSFSQTIDPENKVQYFVKVALESKDEIRSKDLDIAQYFYEINQKGEVISTQKDLSQTKALVYWSTSCGYCKKELKELNELLKENPNWSNNMLIALRVDFKQSLASIGKEAGEYVVYKKNKELMRTTIPIVFLSEKFGEDNGIIANPHTFFYDDSGQLILYKSGYYATKEKMEPNINQQFLEFTLNQILTNEQYDFAH